MSQTNRIHIEIDYQPISSNQIWQGRRFKTHKYIIYEKDLSILLPKKEKIEGGIKIDYIFQIPDNRRRDLDNYIKPLQDNLVKRGYFNDDSQIIEFSVRKIKGPWKIIIDMRSI